MKMRKSVSSLALKSLQGRIVINDSDLSSYSLERIEAVPVDVVVDGGRAGVVEQETDRCLHTVKLHTTSPGD